MKVANTPDWDSLSATDPRLAAMRQCWQEKFASCEPNANDWVLKARVSASFATWKQREWDGRVRLHESRKAWAAELGLTHETLYRLLARLEREGVIVVDGDSIRLQY